MSLRPSGGLPSKIARTAYLQRCRNPAFSELEWARKIAAATGWTADFVVLPWDRTPEHLRQPGNSAQHWEADSTRIRNALGYREPVSIEEGIRRTIEWDWLLPPADGPH